ncbi:MAG: hypothetical protein SNJ69_10485, partial [Chloroflexaceae bacterium]
MADKYGSPSGSYSWLPDFVRKWLNLDEEVPDYGPGAEVGAPLAPPPARPTPRYAAAPAYGAAAPTPGYAPPATGYTPSRPSYTPPAPAYTPPGGAGTTYRAFAAGEPSGSSAPPPAAPRPETAVTPSAPLPPVEGVVQPIGYLIRSYIRGALPPQGLEQFTREARATFTDVWKFYSYWTRFQTDELFRMGRELTDAVLGERGRSLEGGNGGRDQPRRIRVTTTNDTDEAKKTVRNAPPAPTASAATAAASAAASAGKTAEQAAEKAAEATGKAAATASGAAASAGKTAEQAAEKAAEATGKAAAAASGAAA